MLELRVSPHLQGKLCFGAALMKELDSWQIKAVTADGNCVVTAGAGAGKTTVLAERYLHLVLTHRIPVTDILALTFTRKAAAEMYERIYKKLAESEDPFARSQLAIFSQAKITTLDSFCSSIVRKAAPDYGYSPEFAVDDVSAAKIAEKTAYQFVMANRAEPAIDEFLQSHQMDAVVNDFFASIGTALVSPVNLLKQEFSAMEPSIQQFTNEYAESQIQKMCSLCESIRSISLELAAPHDDCLMAINAARQFPDESISTIREHLHRLEPFINTASQLGLKKYGKDALEGCIKENAKELRQCARDFPQVKDLLDSLPLYSEMLKCLDAFALQLAEQKRLADIMDFKDLGLCAVDTLLRRTDIRQELKLSIQRIMIDEFQDNNELQKSLLYLLAEKQALMLDRIPTALEIETDKLFFVGDEKQSIYRFRGADVSVFKKLSRELAQGEGLALEAGGKTTSLVLGANYRSSASLITFFNEFFTSIMNSGTAGDDKDFYAHYETMAVGNSERQNRPFSSLLKFYELAENSEDAAAQENTGDDDNSAGNDSIVESRPDSEFLSADESEALAVAKFIRDNIGVLDVSDRDGNSRKASPADFAILLRKTSPQHLLERYLRHFSIPFILDQPRDLFKESIANDIYNILLLLLEPTNQSAFAAVLRSPLCRISDAGFARIMAQARGFEEIPETLSLDDYDRGMIARGKAFYAKLALEARDAGITKTLHFVWNYSGLRLDFLSHPDSRVFLEHYDFIFSLAASLEAQHGSLSDFVDELGQYIKNSDLKFEPGDVPRDTAPGVRIMTIHKAKGLEFPIVIVPFVHHQNGGSRARIWGKTPYGIALGLKNPEDPESKTTNLLMSLAKNQEKEEMSAEVIRLLYVACTRAEDHLIFFGRKPGRNASDSFYNYLNQYFAQGRRGTFSIARRSEIWIQPANLRKPDTEAFLKAYNAEYSRAESEAILQQFKKKRYTVSELNGFFLNHPIPSVLRFQHQPGSMAVSAQAITIKADIFGTLCHEILAWAVTRNGSLKDFIPSMPIREALQADQLHKAIAHGAALAEAFFATTIWKGSLANAEIESEKPFLLKSGDFIIEGRMDLVIESSDAVVILDFKTGQEGKPQVYAIQLALYQVAMQKIAADKAIKTGIYWLESGSFSWLEGCLENKDIVMLASAAQEKLEKEIAAEDKNGQE